MKGFKLKFVKGRDIYEEEGKTYLITNKRLISICKGIEDVIKRRGLNLKSEWLVGDLEAYLLHNYNPSFERACECDETNCEECEDGTLKSVAMMVYAQAFTLLEGLNLIRVYM